MSRILFITLKPYYPWEGACHRIRHDLEALVTSGHSIDLLAVPIGPPPHVPGVTLLSIPRLPFSRDLPEGPSIRRFVFGILMVMKAVLHAGHQPYALIHGIDNGGIVAWFVGCLTQTPCIFERLTALNPEHVKGFRCVWLRLHRLLERHALKSSDVVIGNDPSMIEMLTRFGRRSRTCVIPDIPAITEEVTRPSRNLAQARYRTAPDQNLVTCVGSDTRFQGLDLFFNAIPHVLASLPETRFVVVGGDVAEIKRMSTALSKAGIEPSVSFTGRIPPGELAALLAVSDVLVSPRRAGVTAPIKVLDYLHSGTPIVAADTPANRAILTPDNAIITRPSPEALADGIIRLCTSAVLGARLSQNGRETLLSEGRSPEAFQQALNHCYEYVLTTP